MPSIYTNLKRNEIDSLVIITNNVYADVKNDDYRLLKNEFLGTFVNYDNVYGLYIVNNELGKEPIKRSLPPFNDTQIRDAENSYRGLAYTYQLFNLYFEIKDGFITKDEARKALLQYGLINFRGNYAKVGKPYKYYKDQTVVCIDLNDMTIKVGDSLFYEDTRKRLQECVIKSIEQNSQVLDQANNGKTGLGLDRPIPKGVILYKKGIK